MAGMMLPAIAWRQKNFFTSLVKHKNLSQHAIVQLEAITAVFI